MHAHSIDKTKSGQTNPAIDPGTTVAATEFSIKKAAAMDACATAKEYLAAGKLDLVEPLLIQALEFRPACHLAYQLLGRFFDQTGLESDAIDCFRGNLPSRLLEQYFKAPRAVAGNVALSCSHKRQTVFAAEKYALPMPGTLKGSVGSGQFKKTKINSTECFVETFSKATLWHDTANTLVLNSEAVEIGQHTVGSVPVLRALMQRHKPRQLHGRVVLLGARGSHNYYHWLADIIPRLRIIAAAGIQLKSVDHFVVPMARSQFARDLLIKAGVSTDQIYETETETCYLSAEQLIVPFVSNRMGYSMGRWLPLFLQQTMLGRLSEGRVGRRRLFINRIQQSAAGRTLLNQQQVEDYFEQRRFEIVLPETMSVTAQAELFSQAGVVVAAHGAGLSNIVYCAPGTKIIEFYGAHIAPCYWAISALNELDYFNHHCVAEEGTVSTGDARAASNRRSAGFSIPVDAAEQLLCLAGVD